MYYESHELLLLLALIPGLFILLKVYLNDRIEREPFRLIVKLILFGVFSTVPAILLELLMDALVVTRVSSSRLLYAIANAFLSAALVEEGLKLLFLRLGTWKSPEFDYHYDAIVYAVSASLGFAMLENVLYVFQYGVTTAILRAFCSVPLHAFCGVFMGFHYGIAKQAQIDGNPSDARRQTLQAFLVPFLIHGTADALLMYGSSVTSILFLVGLVGLYFVSIKRIRYCAEHDVNFVTKTSYPPIPEQPYYAAAAQNRWQGDSPFQYAQPTPFQQPDQAIIRQPPKMWASGWSIAGFLFGLLSYLTLTVFLIPNVLSILFSAIGLRKQRSSLGIAGLILGVTSLLLGIALLIWF